jgi:hypothetical protein
MDLWDMAGVSRQVTAFGLVVGAALVVLVARFVLRRGDRQERVRIDLGGHGR